MVGQVLHDELLIETLKPNSSNIGFLLTFTDV